jgi:hypothetical protein
MSHHRRCRKYLTARQERSNFHHLCVFAGRSVEIENERKSMEEPVTDGKAAIV